MLVFKILTTLIVVSLTPFIVIRDWRYHDRHTKQHQFTTRFILLFWIIGCFGSVIIVWNETYISGQSNKKIDELVQGKDQLLKNLATYQKEIEIKDSELKQLKKITEAISDFSDMAALDAVGLPFTAGAGLEIKSPLSDAWRDLYVIKNDHPHYKFGEEFDEKYRRIIKQFPRFPFAYVGLARSLKNRGDQSWRDYAIQAVSILQKTTMIKGHNGAHDIALSLMEKDLRE